jgi:hypothetical protein
VFKNLSLKQIAWATICFAVMGFFAMMVEYTKGALFEIRNSLAAVEAAKASNKAAEAATLDAMNKLKAALETASAMNNVGKLQANATIVAANQVAAATIKAAETSMHPDNEMYDSVTGPLIGEPSKKIAKLNEQIARLRQRAEHSSGDSRSAEYLAQAARLEEEKGIIEQTAAQNVGDMMNMIISGAGQGFGGMGKLLMGGGTAKPTVRSSAQEQ